MPTDIDTIALQLDECGYNHRRATATDIELGFRMATYRNRADAPLLDLVISVVDDGRYVRIIAPFAFQIGSEHTAAALETCLRFQWSFRLVRFEYDHADGELRPTIHLPVMDAALTTGQLRFAIGVMGATCDRFHPALLSALETGVVPELADSAPPPRVAEIVERLSELTSDQLEVLFAAVTGDGPDSAPDGADDGEAA